ncbi:MAG: 30S ribosomal protein S27e [Candidatus Aenigmarchaeota archaeon]|nr:30S ribosomal protein S27e [Candidatus Aenigmarchaeota archaeon]
MKKEGKDKFVQVKCEKCKNEQAIFTRASSIVKCLVCEEVLAEPTGGKALIKAKVLEYLG